jgi:DivIVA domain-containing protein
MRGDAVATSELESPVSHSADIAAQRFSIGRKGYAPDEVDQFLRQLADRMTRLQGEIEWLRARSEHLEHRTTAAQEAAYARLSRDFMDVVRRADEAATRVRAEAEAQARAEVSSAHKEAARLLGSAAEQAETILTEARAEAQRVLREANDFSVGRSSRTAAPGPGRPRVPDTLVLSETGPMPEVAAEPDDLRLELNSSLFDLFDDFG